MTSSTHPTGTSLIDGDAAPGGGPAFSAADPRGGARLQPGYRSVTAAQLDQAMGAAASARRAAIDFAAMGVALDAMAEAFEAHAELLVTTADAETALGTTRLQGELARTVGQLRMMASEAREGTRRGVIDDPAGEGPAAPALHRTTVPLGIVAVFAASNFPLAFGVAGTDTAAALAAGCPVVAKAHPAQPATAEVCGRLMLQGLEAAGLDSGFVQVLHEEGYEIGQALATHPDTDAIAFTGSLRGGRALFDLAAARPRPIPVYAEMGSLNPLFVSPGAAAAGPDGLAQGILGSALLGEGQFCTKPGLVVLPPGKDGGAVADGVVGGISAHQAAHPLLHQGITSAFERGVAAVADLPGVSLVRAADGGSGCPAAVVQVTPQALAQHASLREEVFGPVTVVVQADDDEVIDLIDAMEPALTATLHFTAREADWARAMADRLARKVGRVIAGGYPTGVRVSPAQHHGGPYPATTSPLHTSVGLAAIDRFLRPVAFQSFDADALPSWATTGTR